MILHSGREFEAVVTTTAGRGSFRGQGKDRHSMWDEKNAAEASPTVTNDRLV